MKIVAAGGLVQVAGVHDVREALFLVRLGVDRIGIPLRLPVHREDLDDAEAARVVRALPTTALAVLITYLEDASAVRALCGTLGAAAVQLHGEVPLAQLEALRRGGPGLRVIKSLVVRGGDRDALLARMEELSPLVDEFITDTHDPATGADGATGKTHDWAVSAALAARSARPVTLAGGLTPANVAAAIRIVRPAAVDAHTGLEGPDGRKDPRLVAAFVAEARRAFAAL